MSKSPKKAVVAVIAVAAAAASLMGGTFAWQNIRQTALNEASDIINPGGRLHDDFNGTNKDIYVENFADEPILARIRLGEFLALTVNAGSDTERKRVLIGDTDPKTDTPFTTSGISTNPIRPKNTGHGSPAVPPYICPPSIRTRIPLPQM